MRRTRTPTRRRRGALALAALLLAGCGGGEEAAPPPRPTLDAAVANELARTSDAIADALDQGDVCMAAGLADDLNAQVIAAINARKVPPAFQEDLQARANELVNEVNCPPPAAEPEPKPDEEADEGKAKKKGKGKKQQQATVELPVEPPIETDGEE